MTFKDIILVILAGILANNYVFENYLGICPVFEESKSTNKALITGIVSAVIMILAVAIVWPIASFLNVGGNGFLNELIAVLIILALVYLLKVLVKKPIGGLFPMVVLNSAVLGLCANSLSAETYLSALLSAFGVALGFIFAALLFAGVKSKLEEKYVPESFRGLPIYLVSAFIISMVLVAFK